MALGEGRLTLGHGVPNPRGLTGNVFTVSTPQKPSGTFVQTFHQLSFELVARKPAPVLACPLVCLIYLLFYKLLMYVWASVQVDTPAFHPELFFLPLVLFQNT
jgi:hypothetical protein